MKRKHFTRAQQRAWQSGTYRVRKTWREFITTIRGEHYVINHHGIFHIYPDPFGFPF